MSWPPKLGLMKLLACFAHCILARVENNQIKEKISKSNYLRHLQLTKGGHDSETVLQFKYNHSYEKKLQNNKT